MEFCIHECQECKAGCPFNVWLMYSMEFASFCLRNLDYGMPFFEMWQTRGRGDRPANAQFTLFCLLAYSGSKRPLIPMGECTVILLEKAFLRSMS